MQWIRKHASFANVTSLMALVVALSGTAYAGVTLARNSVGSGQIKRGGVANSDIRNNAVTSAKIRNGTIGPADLARGVLSNSAASTSPGPAGPRGATGPQGPQGAQGPQGVPGVNGLLGPITVQRTDVVVADGTTGFAEATCPAGTVAISGGASVEQTGADDIQLLVSRPGPGSHVPASNETVGVEFPSTWRTAYRNTAGATGNATIRSFVFCIDDALTRRR